MKVGWFHYVLPANEPVARGFFTTAYFLHAGLKLVPGLDLVDVGPGNIHKNHLKRAGLDAIFHFCPPHRYNHVAHLGVPNFLLSMWETPVLPKPEADRIRQAEYKLVPSTFNLKVWETAGMSAGLVPLGAASCFHEQPTERRLIRNVGGAPRIRFLYVGTRQPRKGYHLIAPAWRAAFENTDAALHTQLYVKIAEEKQEVRQPYGDDRMVLDTRMLEPADLAALYGLSDVFMFPSLGEGFGLPALEAMASGCLVIAPMTAGLRDFVRLDTALVLQKSGMDEITYGEKFKAKVPTAQDLARALRYVYDNWGTPAAEECRLNGIRFARQFTWERSVQILHETIKGTLEARSEGAA